MVHSDLKMYKIFERFGLNWRDEDILGRNLIELARVKDNKEIHEVKIDPK